MHEALEKLLEAGRVKPEMAEKLDQIAPGRFRYHKNLGAGEVQDWDLRNKKVTIAFEGDETKEMDLQLAFNKTELIPEDDMRAQRVHKMEELRAQATDNPTELIASILRTRPNQRMTLDQMDAELSGSIVPEAQYKKWWEKTKKILREDRLISVPTKRTEPIVLRDEDATPGEALFEDFNSARTAKSRVKALELLQRELPLVQSTEGLLEKLISRAGEHAAPLLKLNPAAALEVVALRDEIAEGTDSVDLIPEDAPRIHEFLQVAGKDLSEGLDKVAAARLKRILEAFPTAFGDDWVTQILRVFDRISARGVTEISKLMEEHGKTEQLKEHIRVAVSRHALGPDALAWICRERNKGAADVFDGQVGGVILSVLEQDAQDDGPRKTGRLSNLLMDDKELVADLLKDQDPNEIRNFSRKLLNSPAFTELDRKSLMARVIKSHPDTGDMMEGQGGSKREETLVVSYESLDRRRAEYEDLVNNKIPSNKKDISVARSYGDLRENFEYHEARRQGKLLETRRSELERDLDRARPTDFKGADAGAVNIGTVFTLVNPDGNETETTLLGAWDSDPDKNVLSYLSEMGQALLGKQDGDTAKVTDLETEKPIEVTVKDIRAFA